MRHAIVPAALLFATTLTLVACDASPEPPKAPAPADSSVSHTPNATLKALPALYVVLTWEVLFKGENLARKNYRARLAACREAGQPIQSLSAAGEARLGSGQGDIAIDARHQVARQITWTASGDGSDL